MIDIFSLAETKNCVSDLKCAGIYTLLQQPACRTRLALLAMRGLAISDSNVLTSQA